MYWVQKNSWMKQEKKLMYKKIFVRSQNIRLNEVEEELLDHKTKNEHLSFELGKGVKKKLIRTTMSVHYSHITNV